MQRRTQALFGLGGVALLSSIGLGAPWTGFSMDIAALLFRVGLVYVVLGVGTALFSPVTVRQAIKIAGVAIAVVFLTGVGTMYYDLVLTPPAFGTELTMPSLLKTQAAFAVLFTPLGAGYVCGVLRRRRQVNRRLLLFGGSMTGGWVAATALTHVGGTARDFAFILYFIVILATSVAALPPLTLMRRPAGSQGAAPDEESTT